MKKFNRDKFLNKLRKKNKLQTYRRIVFMVLPWFLVLILGFYLTYAKYFVKEESEVVKTTVGDFLYGDVVIGAYINGEYASELPKKGTGYVAEKVVCDNDTVGEWNDDEWYLITKNLTKRSKCNIYFKFGTFTFAYTGGEQKFTVPTNGVYKLETWGAQGGNSDGSTKLDGAVGGYSVGLIKLTTNDILYINVGGQGQPGNKNGSSILFGGAGGYNGGGTGGLGLSGYASANGGGGATHIATKSGLLSSLENSKDSILIVSGGGGGFTSACVAAGGSGGGISSTAGNNDYLNSSNQNKVVTKATQDNGYAFGKGEDGHQASGGNCGCEGSGGAGGGFYGGFTYQPSESNEANANVSGSGGSGYIGNLLLSEKVMYCYNCEESNEESTKTISTTCASESSTENCTKKGNGYAKITLVSTSDN